MARWPWGGGGRLAGRPEPYPRIRARGPAGGRIARWLDPSDPRWLARRCRCRCPDEAEREVQGRAYLWFRASATLHKSGLAGADSGRCPSG
ncbi:hypothetical protein ABT072_19895 [Streptomyces sp. NPDC002589]|uniref:hypothetical protein n=1 Tax=Streptomyces sp. NPDC002589 TaxID=3154420 RepID=UPI00331A2AF3